MPLVKNNEARIHTIGAPKGGTEIRLMPGANEVDADAWATAKTLPVIQAHLRAKTLEEVGASGKTAHPTPGPSESLFGKPHASVEPPTSLAQLKPDEAKALVGDTFDKELLGRWKKSDSRKGVQDAIDEQLELIKINK